MPTASACVFHQWAYETFLWLVSDPGGKGGAPIFEGFANPKDLLKRGGPGETPYPGRAEGEGRTMLARMGKSRTTADIEDIFQAGLEERFDAYSGQRAYFYDQERRWSDAPFWIGRRSRELEGPSRVAVATTGQRA